jgi:hypothetical protein
MSVCALREVKMRLHVAQLIEQDLVVINIRTEEKIEHFA